MGQLLRRYPAYTWLLVGCALLMACHSATCTYMIHIVGKVGGSESMMGSALAVAAFLELPAMGLFSRMRRKVPLAWLLIFCAAFFVIRAGLFWAARSVPVQMCIRDSAWADESSDFRRNFKICAEL